LVGGVTYRGDRKGESLFQREGTLYKKNRKKNLTSFEETEKKEGCAAVLTGKSKCKKGTDSKKRKKETDLS